MWCARDEIFADLYVALLMCGWYCGGLMRAVFSSGVCSDGRIGAALSESFEHLRRLDFADERCLAERAISGLRKLPTRTGLTLHA